MPDLSKMNLYEILGVSRSSTNHDIKIAFRDLARIYHPDSKFYSDLIDTPPTPESIKKFELITLAYETLIDPKKRGEYDLKLTSKEATPNLQQNKTQKKKNQKDKIPNENVVHKVARILIDPNYRFIISTFIGAFIGILTALAVLFAVRFIN